MWTIRIAFSVFAFVALYLIFSGNLPSNAEATTTRRSQTAPHQTLNNANDSRPTNQQTQDFQPIPQQSLSNPTVQQGTTGQESFKPIIGGPDQLSESNSDLGIEVASDKSYLVNYRCRVQLIKDVEVPALEAGQIKKIFVKENDVVQVDQDLGTLRDEAARLQKEVAVSNVAIAKVDAENENRIKFAYESKVTADQLFQASKELQKRGSIGLREFKDDELKAKQSALQLDEAQFQKKQALEKLKLEQVNMKAADDLIDRHLIKAGCDGQVAEIFVEEGEWVNRGDKVMRIIQMDRLRIDGRANSNDFFHSDLDGKSVTVTQTLPDKSIATFTGIVRLVKLENSVSNKLFFEVEIQNKRRGNYWLLRPNSEVDIKVQLK